MFVVCKFMNPVPSIVKKPIAIIAMKPIYYIGDC